MPQIFQAHEKAVSGLSVVLRPPFFDFLASGAQNIPNDSPAGGEGIHSEEEAFAMDDEDSDGELNTWELSEGVSSCPPKEQAADLFNEDWDLELKADQGNPYGRCGVYGVLGQDLRFSCPVTPRGRWFGRGTHTWSLA